MPRPDVEPVPGRTGSEARFEDALRRVAERLELPQPERTRILEEVATDLEELRAGLMNRGIPEGEAELRATNLLMPSEPAVDALVRLHEPLHRKLTRRFSPTVMRRAERTVLLLVTAAALGPMLAVLLGSGVLSDPSPLLWLTLVLAGGVLFTGGRKAIQLLFVRNHDPHALRRGLGRLLAGSGIALGLGMAGVVLELYGLAAAVEATGQATAEQIIPWLLDSSALLAASLITALLGGLCWFLLLQKVEAVERAHQRAGELLGTRPPPPSFTISGSADPGGFDDSRSLDGHSLDGQGAHP